MGALPKNKITSVERGKRRAGNRPQLKKDAHAKAPLHKRGFLAELFKFAGLEAAGLKSDARSARADKKAAQKTSHAVAAPVVNEMRASKADAQSKAVRKTQHKG